MDEFEKIQKLIRLKRHEMPPEDFVEGFLQTFREKQRTELMKRSVWSLMKERIEMFFDELFVPKWALACGAIALAAVMAWAMYPSTGSSAGSLTGADKGAAQPAVDGGDIVRPHKGEAFAVDGIRIMMEVENQMEIEVNEIALHLNQGHGTEMIVVPTGNGMGIAVPVEKFMAAFNQSAVK